MARVNWRGPLPVGIALLTATTVDLTVRPRASTTSVAKASVTCLAADFAGGCDAYTGVRIGRAGRLSGVVSDACLPVSAAGARPLRTNVPRDTFRSQEIGAASPSTIAATSRSVTVLVSTSAVAADKRRVMDGMDFSGWGMTTWNDQAHL